MFHIHRWGKWKVRSVALYIWQVRECKGCGRVQERAATHY